MSHSPQLNPTIRSCHKGNVLKISAVDVAIAVTGCDRKQCHKMIENTLKRVNHSEKAHQFLWDKHKFPGMGQRPTYVLTINEAISFTDCLPARHTEDVKE
eukprot:858771-Rhodomonas_salina.2